MSEKIPIINDQKSACKEPWYRDGLRFTCTGCGKCCTGAPGYIWVTVEEIVAIANRLNLTVDEFSRRYVRKVGSRFSLKERREEGLEQVYSCIFLKDNKCSIYDVRPEQCKTFPWWKENLSSPEAWKRCASDCEGINHPDASLVPFEEIERQKS